MRVFGIDFTSVPGRRKPITCVSSLLIGETLTVEHNLELVIPALGLPVSTFPLVKPGSL
jgi:hypothetical protein